MKNVYTLLKLNRHIKNNRIKNLGVFLLHYFGQRYCGIFIDPTLKCNLRCKMCYFSEEGFAKSNSGPNLTLEEINKIGNAFFHRALKLQIGCRTEPSLYPYNKEIILLAKKKKVPYISITTNANRFKEENWEELVASGLDEVTLSLHGVHKESYEFFMTNGSYEMFLSSFQVLTRLKKKYPKFQIRINYTVNQDNLQELTSFFDVFKNYHVDILQVRPILQMGNTVYNNFSWDTIVQDYDPTIERLRKLAKQKNITFIAPTKHDLIKEINEESTIIDSTYFYISSQGCWKDGFDLNKDTYETYAKRTGLGRKLFKKTFCSSKKSEHDKRPLNYNIS